MKSDFELMSRTALAERWWTWMVRGVLAIVFGILAFAVPKATLGALVILFGVYAIAEGVFDLTLAAFRGSAGLRWGWPFFEGLVGIGAGIVTLVWPEVTAFVLLFVIAAWAVLTGIAEVSAAISLRRYIRGEWLLAASGVFSIVLGVWLFARPATGAVALAWAIGAYAIVFGALLVTLGARIKQIPSGGAPTPT